MKFQWNLARSLFLLATLSFACTAAAQTTKKQTPPAKEEMRTGGKNTGRSNNTTCCAGRVGYIPPGSGGAAQQKSRFTLMNKSGGTNPTLFNGNKPADEVEVTVFDANGASQDPKNWSIRNEGDVMVVDLSKLPKGKYTIKVQAGKETEEYKTS